ncbi:unnamed protein product [Rotaria socialis]
MMPDRTKCELAHLYFNPKTHKDGIPVRPIENKILRPIFDDKCKDTTIIDGASLITEFSKYNNKGLLKPATHFCTFDIRNLYTMLPQEQALNSLMKFLSAYGYRKVKGISTDTIKKLASIVLNENVFAYGKKIYKQTTGGTTEQTKIDKFYGRYIDDIFMTWNRFEEELRKLLDDANTWHRNIKLDYKIGNSLPFLDVQLKNYEEKSFLHYTHEKSFKFFKRDMHCVYEHIFKSTPTMYAKLIVGNRNRRQATNVLIRKRPTQTFLQNNITQNKLQTKNKEFKNKIFLYL